MGFSRYIYAFRKYIRNTFKVLFNSNRSSSSSISSMNNISSSSSSSSSCSSSSSTKLIVLIDQNYNWFITVQKQLITIFKTYNFKIITFYLEHLISLIDYNI